jgi:hypothetical protein
MINAKRGFSRRASFEQLEDRTVLAAGVFTGSNLANVAILDMRFRSKRSVRDHRRRSSDRQSSVVRPVRRRPDGRIAVLVRLGWRRNL